MSSARGQRGYVGRSYSWNAGGATRPGATSPGSPSSSCAPASALGSRPPTCGLALTRNTCPQQLPRAEELFETPYPVWELFQMKSATLPCIKTNILKREKKKKRRAARSLVSEKQPCTAVTLPSRPRPTPHAVAPHPCLLPPCLPGLQDPVKPCLGLSLPAWNWQSFMPAFLPLLFFFVSFFMYLSHFLIRLYFCMLKEHHFFKKKVFSCPCSFTGPTQREFRFERTWHSPSAHPMSPGTSSLPWRG